MRPPWTDGSWIWIQLSRRVPRSFTISATVIKSRYRNPAAAAAACSETGGDNDAASSRKGADEITWSAEIDSLAPPLWLYWIDPRFNSASNRHAVTLDPSSTRPPIARTRSAHFSHIMPGPSRGYRNE